MRKSTSGFTIVELLIVVVVIAILAAISVTAYSNIQGRARDSKRQSDIASIVKLLELYRIDNGGYPICNGTGSYQPGVTTLSSGTFASCFTDELVPAYVGSLPLDPVNVAPVRYYYAVGYQKNVGVNSYSGNQSNNYIIGANMDSAGGSNYSGWGVTLNYLTGSSN